MTNDPFAGLPLEVTSKFREEITRIVASGYDDTTLEVLMIPINDPEDRAGITLAVLARGRIPSQESLSDMEPDQSQHHRSEEAWIRHYAHLASEVIRRALGNDLMNVTIFPYYTSDELERNAPTHVMKCIGHYHVFKLDPFTSKPNNFDEAMIDESHDNLGNIIYDAIAHIYIPLSRRLDEEKGMTHDEE